MDAEGDSDLIKDWDTCWKSPQKKKRKKKYKKDKNGNKIKGEKAEKESTALKKKKQKNTKLKEVTKKKKKNRKKDKESVNVGLDDSLQMTQDDSAPNPVARCIRPEQISAVKPSTSNSQSDMQAKPNKIANYLISPKKSKIQKKVAFNLSPGYICAKPSRVISQPPQAKDSNFIFSESQVIRDEKRQYGTQAGQSQSQPPDNDSQCTGDDTFSQDLFITQKTFRCSSPEPSSGENMEEGISSIPLTKKRPASPHLMLKHAAPDRRQKHLQTHDQHELPQLHQEMRKPKKPGQDVTKLPKETHTPNQKNQMSLFPLISTTNTSTQTENFYTAELSFLLRFCKERKVTESSEDLKPVDLSLPQRTRAQLGNQHLPPSPIEIRDGSEELIYSSVDNKENKRGNDETAPSPQSEPKSTDTTTSSEDSEYMVWRLTQVRAVQTKLNESFYFKPKGDVHSPRPDSPLMKFDKGKKGGTRH